MDPLELEKKLRTEGAVRYAGKKGPGMFGDYAADPSWPYMGSLGTLSAFITNGRFTYEQVRDAIWKQLDLYGGNAYGAFVKTHDNGGNIVYFLLGKGGDELLLKPLPLDTRFAPLNDAIQTDFLSKGLDLYGNPMVDFHRNEGAAKWAAFASNPPYNAFDVKPETARWLLLNNLINGGNDRNEWAKYAQKTIAEACYIIESEFNHPGVV